MEQERGQAFRMVFHDSRRIPPLGDTNVSVRIHQGEHTIAGAVEKVPSLVIAILARNTMELCTTRALCHLSRRAQDAAPCRSRMHLAGLFPPFAGKVR
jgi:hypothetical protein